MPRQKCTEIEFIEKARSVHGDFFDYSRIVYLDSKSKIEIICKEHGPFIQTPKAHLQGQGCPICRLSKLGRSLSLEEFKQRISCIHGGEYTLIDTSYVNASSVVEVVCPIHGIIKMRANSLLRGSGCRKCAMKNKREIVTDTASFITQANEIHGDRYQYASADYKGTKQKVIITCPTHGNFLQTAEAHLQGRGCPLCAHERKSLARVDDETVFVESSAKHGDKYKYIDTFKRDGKRFVRYICPIHGEVAQEVRNHRAGMGCPKCSSRNKTTEEFIVESKSAHGDKYDYSRVAYSYSSSPVIIICRLHGPFSQTPGAHLAGYGCPRCGIAKASDQRRKSPEEFLEQAKSIHGDKYLYPDLSFKSGGDYIRIVCPIHGEFQQQVNSHINQESGCPKCWRGFSRGEECIEQILSKRGVTYIRQKTFDGELLSEKGVPLRFDFFLPTFNMIIEYDGAQHFIPFPYSKDEDEKSVIARFQLTVLHDEMKNEFAKAKGISMVRFSYLEFKKLAVLIGQVLDEQGV